MAGCEVFIGKTAQNRNKKFFVSGVYLEALHTARKTLRVSRDHICMKIGYVVGDDLYLGDQPMKNGQKKVWVASYKA